MTKKPVLRTVQIEKRIFLIRGQKVIMDSHLAVIYGVTTKRLNEQVRRNLERFPNDFMFQLTKGEYEGLRSQFETSKKTRGGRRYMPYVFTEHGTLMLANVLNSKTAIQASIQVVRTFIRLREIAVSYKELAGKLTALERKYEKQDEQIKAVFDAVRQLMEPKIKSKRKIGY